MAQARQQIVGYYRIREGSAFILTADEISLARDLFQQPASVVLLIERRDDGPAKGTFFFWKGEAFVYNLPLPEFAIDPTVLAAEPAAPAVHELQSRPMVTFSPPIPAKHASSRIALVAALVLACVTLVSGYLTAPDSSSDRGETVAAVPNEIAAAPVLPKLGRDIAITWDPQTAAISNATAGVLNIDDGGVQRRISLDVGELRFGRILYSPTTDHIKVELSAVQIDGRTLEAAVSAGSATFVNAHVPAPRNEPPVREVKAPAPEKHVERAAPTAPDPPATLDRRVPAKSFRLTTAGNPKAAAPVLLDAPALQSTPAFVQPLVPSLSAALRPPGPPTSHMAPTSGRLIWTGTLQRRGVVEFDGHSVSVGSLSGSLPGVPVTVRISPAEFSGDGLVVYTTDASRNDRSEPPSASNGWNRIHFVWDPEKANQIAVLESPNPSNRFNRLALRNDARRCAMILIDWTSRPSATPSQ